MRLSTHPGDVAARAVRERNRRAEESNRRRWTIHVCPLCGEMDPDQHQRSPDRPRFCVFAARGLSRDGIVLHPYSNSPDWNPEIEYAPIEVRRAAGETP